MVLPMKERGRVDQIEASDLILPLSSASASLAHAGGKGANLATLALPQVA